MINIILFHVLFLSLLEIVFYFEYIGPLETEIFKGTFKNLIKHYTNEYDEYENTYDNIYGNEYILISKSNPNFNMTIGNNSYTENKSKINNAKKEREDHNNELYETSMTYWFIFLFFVILSTSLKISFDYYCYIKKKNMNRVDSNNSIELRNMDSILLRNSYSNHIINYDNQLNNQSNESNENNILEEDNFISFKKIKKILLEKSIFYFILGGLILLFEYLFFNHIVLNYKVLSNEEILNMLYSSFDPLILNYLIYNKNNS